MRVLSVLPLFLLAVLPSVARAHGSDGLSFIGDFIIGGLVAILVSAFTASYCGGSQVRKILVSSGGFAPSLLFLWLIINAAIGQFGIAAIVFMCLILSFAGAIAVSALLSRSSWRDVIDGRTAEQEAQRQKTTTLGSWLCWFSVAAIPIGYIIKLDGDVAPMMWVLIFILGVYYAATFPRKRNAQDTGTAAPTLQKSLFNGLLVRAEGGDAEAQYTLGNKYHDGLDIERSDADAFFWYLKAAEQGHSAAKFQVAQMYAQGEGVARDWAEVYFWTAAGEPAHLRGALNEKARTQLSSGQLCALDERIAVWKPQLGKP